jgi:hypothetical protein
MHPYKLAYDMYGDLWQYGIMYGEHMHINIQAPLLGSSSLLFQWLTMMASTKQNGNGNASVLTTSTITERLEAAITSPRLPAQKKSIPAPDCPGSSARVGDKIDKNFRLFRADACAEHKGSSRVATSRMRR